MVNQYFQFLKLFLFSRYKFITAITIILSILSAVFSGIGLGLYIPVISSFLESGETQNIFVSLSNFVVGMIGLQPSLLVLIVIATTVIIIGNLTTYITTVLTGSLSFSFIRDVKKQLITDLLNRPYSWFLNIKTGRVVSILNEQAAQAAQIVGNILTLLVYILLSLAYLCALFIISMKLTSIMILFGGFILYATYFFSRKIYSLLKIFQDIKLHQSFAFTEIIIGIKTIKSMGLENFVETQTYPVIEKERKTSFKTQCWYHFQPFFNSASSITLASIGIYAGLKVFAMTGAEVIIFLLAINRLNASIHTVNGTWLALTKSFPSIEIIMKHLVHEKRKEPGIAKFQFEQAIELKRVSFAYKDDLVLKDINLKIDKKQFIAFVGSSGGGKTTLIDLIMGLYQPTSGEILYDNQPMSYYDRNEFCKHVGVVTQDVFLLNDTIANNISYGDPDPDMERIRNAAKTAYADEFINKCSEGYETILGDRGIKVSGGQRQRIALARALYHQPELLVLDEATSALDSESEKYIQQALKEMHGQLTIIAVAHRLSTIREADIIYYIENGEVKEKGTHETLMENGKFYKKLKLMQLV